jgi:hypothetical protein
MIKMGIFTNLGIFSEKYEGGLPDIQRPTDVQIVFSGSELSITPIGFFNQKKIVLVPEQIIEVGLDKQIYRSSGKAAAGAIIGGVLTGGIGLIAGAAIGGKRRTENNLHLIVEQNGREYEVHFKPSKSTQQLCNEFVKFSARANKTLQAESFSNEKISSSASEIERLCELLNKGALTQDQFEILKNKIINS